MTNTNEVTVSSNAPVVVTPAVALQLSELPYVEVSSVEEDTKTVVRAFNSHIVGLLRYMRTLDSGLNKAALQQKINLRMEALRLNMRPDPTKQQTENAVKTALAAAGWDVASVFLDYIGAGRTNAYITVSVSA
jgi:hypothetical protein